MEDKYIGLNNLKQYHSKLKVQLTKSNSDIKQLIDNIVTGTTQVADALQASNYNTESGTIKQAFDTINFAVSTLQTLVNGLQGGTVIIGTLDLNTSAVTSSALNQFVSDAGYAAIQKGYTVIDADKHEWYYNGTEWIDTGVFFNVPASDSMLGVVKGGNDYVSILNGVITVLKTLDSEKLGGQLPTYYATQSALTKAVNSLTTAINTAQSTADSKYTKPSTGIPESDLSEAVQNKLNKEVPVLSNEDGDSTVNGSTQAAIKGIMQAKNYYNLAVFDTYVSNGDGTGIGTKKSRIRNYRMSEVRPVSSNYTNIVYYAIPKPTDYAFYGTFSDKGIICNKFQVGAIAPSWDGVENIGRISGYAQSGNFWIGFPIGTTLAQAQQAIDGLIIQYELDSIYQYSEQVIENQPIRPANQEEELYWNEEWRKGLNLYSGSDITGAPHNQSIGRYGAGTYTITTQPIINAGTGLFIINSDGSHTDLLSISPSNPYTTFTLTKTEELGVYNHADFKIMLVRGSHPYSYEPYNGEIVREKDLSELTPADIGALAPSDLKAGDNITITPGDNGVTISSSGGSADIPAATPTTLGAVYGNTQDTAHSTTTALGYNANANGNNSIALGYNAKALSGCTISIGQFANSRGVSGVALGARTNVMDGSVAVGYRANASWSDSIAIGNNAIANASQTTAIGYWSNISGAYSVAIGVKANAAGAHSVALGYNALADMSNAITLGDSNISYLRCAQTRITSLSDKRLKIEQGQVNTALCLNSVESIPVRRFHFVNGVRTGDKDFTKLGFFAQEVEKVYPKDILTLNKESEYESNNLTEEERQHLLYNGAKFYTKEVEIEDAPAEYETVTKTDVESGEEYTERVEKSKPKEIKEFFSLPNVKELGFEQAIPTLWGAVQYLSKRVKELQEEINLIRGVKL